jgi:hypothetical protein
MAIRSSFRDLSLVAGCMNKLLLALLALCALTTAHGNDFATTSEKANWYRGNTNAHSINAEGNVAADVVVRWYREHGYQFLFLTENEQLIDVKPLNALYGARSAILAAYSFVVLRGQEVSQRLADESHPDGMRRAHVNGLGIDNLVMPVGSEGNVGLARGVSMSELYVRNFAAVRAAGGIPQVNHPNFRWSVKPQDLSAVSGPFLFEIANASPGANNFGAADDNGDEVLSTEAFWDVLLSQGKTAWAVASDDSHDYLHLDDLNSERPGKGWIMLRAVELTPATVQDALLRGDFYASTGVTLADYRANATSVAIKITRSRDRREDKSKAKDDRRFTTRFIGKEGRVLATVGGLEPTYTIRGDEGYVRATIVDSNGMSAWTQPVFIRSR